MEVGSLAAFAGDLQQALNDTFPRDLSPYTGVYVLLLRWEEDDLKVQNDINVLRKVCEGKFHYDVWEWHLPSIESPTLALQDRLYAFLSAHRDKNELVIVYYGGHGVASSDGKCIWQANRKANNPTLRWHAVQSLLENAMPHVLIILDCCYAGAAARDLGGGTTKELLAACGRDSTTPAERRRSFTSVLIEELHSFGRRRLLPPCCMQGSSPTAKGFG